MNRSASLSTTATALVVLAWLAAGSPALAAEVRLDGRTVPAAVRSLAGTPDAPAAGDLLLVAGIWVRLDGPDLPALRTERREWGRMLVVEETGRPLAIEIEHGSPDLAGDLDATALRGLRGVRVDANPSGLRDRLLSLDVARVALTLSDRAAVGRERAVPALPGKLECLVLEAGISNGFQDFRTLGELKELRVLLVGGLLDLPGALVAAWPSLRVLHAEIRDLSAEAFAGLGELRELDLSWSDDVEDLAFATPLGELRILRVAGTGIRDLEPVRALRHLVEIDLYGTFVSSLAPLGGLPDLRVVRATRSRVRELPDGELPRLELLAAVGGEVSDAEAERFRSGHPRCRLHLRRMDPLRDAVRGATRLRIRTGGTCDASEGPGIETLFETEDPAAIRELLDGIELVEPRPGEWPGQCMCCGHPTIEFRAGDRLLASVSIHHGASLRWSGWSGDACLTERGAAFLREWLAGHRASDER